MTATRWSYVPATGVGAVAMGWLAIAAVESAQPAPIGSTLTPAALAFAGLNGVAALTLLPFRRWFRTLGVVVGILLAGVTFLGALPGDRADVYQGAGGLYTNFGVFVGCIGDFSFAVWAAVIASQEPWPNRNLARKYGVVISRSADGTVGIVEVTPGGAGDRAGLRVGDSIVAVNGAPVSTSDHLVLALRNARGPSVLSVRAPSRAVREVALTASDG